MDSEVLEKAYKNYESGNSLLSIANKLKINYKTIFYHFKKKYGKLRGCGNYSKIYKVDENFFEKIDTEPKAYWLGFILADGNIFKTVLSIGLKEPDIEHLQKFKGDIKSTHPVKIVKRASGFPSDNNLAMFVIKNKKISEDLKKLGIMECKSLIVTPPELHKDLERHFWRGVIDGDGCLQIRGRKKCISSQLQLYGSRKTCYSFSKWFQPYFKFYTSIRKNGSIWRAVVCGQKAERLIEFIYTNCSVYLDRKHKLAMASVNKEFLSYS